MFIADEWEDYEVLDASDGEKLERWGEYLLIRPDPQVIWSSEKKNRGWKECNARYFRSSKGGGEWKFYDLPDEVGITSKDEIKNIVFAFDVFDPDHASDAKIYNPINLQF